MPNYTWNVITSDPKTIKAMLNEKGEFDFNNFIPRPPELEHTTAGGRVAELIGLYMIENFTYKQYKDLISRYNFGYGVFDKGSKKATREYYLERLGSVREDIIYDGYGENAKEICRLTGADYFEMHMKYGSHDWYEWDNNHWGTKWNAFDVTISDDSIVFTTAWCSPDRILEEICRRFPKAKINFEAEYEDNFLFEAENRGGTFVIINEYKKDFSNFDPENDDYEDLEWISLRTGKARIA